MDCVDFPLQNIIAKWKPFSFPLVEHVNAAQTGCLYIAFNIPDVYLYKCMTDLAPAYLSKPLELVSYTRDLHSIDPSLLAALYHCCISLGSFCFHCCGPRPLNGFALTIRNSFSYHGLFLYSMNHWSPRPFIMAWNPETYFGAPLLIAIIIMSAGHIWYLYVGLHILIQNMVLKW